MSVSKAFHNYFQTPFSLSQKTQGRLTENVLAFESKRLGVFSRMPKRFSKGYFYYTY